MSDSSYLESYLNESEKCFIGTLKALFISCPINTQYKIGKGSEFDKALNELLKASFAYYATVQNISFIPVEDEALSIAIQNPQNNNNLSSLSGVSQWRFIYGDLFLQPLSNGTYVTTGNDNDSILTYTLKGIKKVSTGLHQAFYQASLHVHEIIVGVISDNHELVGNNFCAKDLAKDCLRIFTKKTSASQNKFLSSINELLLEPELLHNLPAVEKFLEDPDLCEKMLQIKTFEQLIEMYHIDKLLLEPSLLNNLPTVGELLKNPALCELFSIPDINQLIKKHYHEND